MQASEISALSQEFVSGNERTAFGTVRLESVWPARVRGLETLETFLNVEELLEERLEGCFTASSDVEAALLQDAVASAEAEDHADGEVLRQLLQQSSTQTYRT